MFCCSGDTGTERITNDNIRVTALRSKYSSSSSSSSSSVTKYCRSSVPRLIECPFHLFIERTQSNLTAGIVQHVFHSICPWVIPGVYSLQFLLVLSRLFSIFLCLITYIFPPLLERWILINFFKFKGHFMSPSLTLKLLHLSHSLHRPICVLCGSQHKQGLFTYTISVWLL